MKLYTTILLIFSVCISASGKDLPKYPVSAIPDDLKANVNVVIRKYDLFYTIQTRSSATEYVFLAATIFNSNGGDYAEQIVHYDKLSKITSIKASIYDAQGNLVRKLKQSEIIDHAAFDGFTLYSDNRLKVLDLSHHSVPFTIELEYEIQHNFQFYIPRFEPLTEENVSVEHAQFRLTYPANLKPKYKSYNIQKEPDTEKLNDGRESTTWTLQNIKAVKFEYYAPPSSQTQYVVAAPVVFEFEGYSGTLGSWNELGKWIGTLNKGRNVLPEATKAKLVSLTQNLPTREEKIKAVYRYMQGRTRYVGIQLGIGGFQPFDAITVDKTGYGDCKALSNYMVAMLDAIDIKASYVLIYAGSNNLRMDTSFPSSQFNHAVVCVPNERDTIWLECTSQRNPFGYMGMSTGNRKALAITDQGASVVNTPVYNETHNIQARTAKVTIAPDGNAIANVRTSYQGLRYDDDNLSDVLDNYDDQKRWILENTAIPSFDLSSFVVSNSQDKIPVATIDMSLRLNRYGNINGKRLFLTPNLMNRSATVIPKAENRKHPVYLKYAFTEADTITYEIPEQLYPEFVPEDVSIQSPFGEYQSTYKLDQGRLTYTRKFLRRSGFYKPESYNELIDFYKQISKADNAKVVFLNKT